MFTKLINHMCILGIVAAISGCVSAGTVKPHFKTWQEEVKLNDGRVIVVTQKRRCDNEYPSICFERETWLTVYLAEISEKPILWNQRLYPRILNIFRGKLYVVGYPFTDVEFRLYGRPNPPYIGYRYDNGLWTQIPLNDIPVEIYDTNLVLDGSKITTELLSLSMKDSEEFNGSGGYKSHQKRLDPNYKTRFDQ